MPVKKDQIILNKKETLSDEYDSQEERDLLVLASVSQKKALEGKKDLQIQGLQKKIKDLDEKLDAKRTEFTKNMKLYQDTTKVLTESLSKSHASLKTLKESQEQDFFVQKSIYESAESEYLCRIQELKAENQKFMQLNQQLHEEGKILKSELQNSKRQEDDLRLEFSKTEKDQNDSLHDLSRKYTQKRLEELEKHTTLEKILDENSLLKSNIEHLLLQIHQMEDICSKNQINLEQIMNEHELEIRIWKSRVSELEAYLNLSKQKIKSFEEVLAVSEAKSLKMEHSENLSNGSSKSPILSRGSSVETLCTLADDFNFSTLKGDNSLTKAERIQAEDRLSELLIKNFLQEIK